MNPWGFIIIGLGMILFIVGFKGAQHDILSAITGHTQSGSTASSSGGGGKSGTGQPPPVQAV